LLNVDEHSKHLYAFVVLDESHVRGMLGGRFEELLQFGVFVRLGFPEIVCQCNGELLLVLVILKDGWLLVLGWFVIIEVVFVAIEDVGIHFLGGWDLEEVVDDLLFGEVGEGFGEECPCILLAVAFRVDDFEHAGDLLLGHSALSELVVHFGDDFTEAELLEGSGVD
jgi:hypothetical protein